MNEPQISRLRVYAWNYFAYHADQRLKTFNFYLVLVGILVAGLLTYLSRSRASDDHLPSAFCGVLAMLSLGFWRLDKRNANLVKNGERALTYLDSQEGHTGEAEVLALFAVDDAGAKHNPERLHVSFSAIFGLIFWAFAILASVWAVLLWP